MPSIEVRELSRTFGAAVALDRISFDVAEGTFFGCFGPNGAGKTTLLRVLTGQLPPTSGRAFVAGIDAGTTASLYVRKWASCPRPSRHPPT